MGDSFIIKWKPPPRESFKINVDGSAGNSCATTALIRHHKGSFIHGESRELTPCDPVEAEAMMFLLGLQLGKDLPDKLVLLERDNQTIVKILPNLETHPP